MLGCKDVDIDSTVSVGADDGIANLDLLECIHVQHAKLQNPILSQSLPRPCLQCHVVVVFERHLIKFCFLCLTCIATINNVRLLHLYCLAGDVRLRLFMLCGLELLELLELFLISFEELLESVYLVARILFAVELLKTLIPGTWLECRLKRICRERLLLDCSGIIL